VLEQFSRPNEEYCRIVITRDHKRAFVSHARTTGLLVFDLEPDECAERAAPLINQYSGDGTFHDAVDTTSLVAHGMLTLCLGRSVRRSSWTATRAIS
jgi:hypothetical protein